MAKTPDKLQKATKSKAKAILRAEIVSRFKVSDAEFGVIPNKNSFINKMLTNEIIPKDKEKLTRMADNTCSELLNIK
jgi:hypothetical protein